MVPGSMSPASLPRLLLVDDEPDMLDFLERALRRRFEVHRFCDPLSALADVQAHRYDVILSDQKMPALTGLELLAQAADLWPDSIRVLITGYTAVPEIAGALSSSHIHTCVLKPVDATRLLEAIDAARQRAGEPA